MPGKKSALLGVLAPLVGYVFIAVAIAKAPWFSWQSNALSDLGHARNSAVAPLFNLGLFLTGALLLTYAVTVFHQYAVVTSWFLSFTSISLQLISIFDEVYSSLHYVVSVLFFVLLGCTSIVYVLEKKSSLAAIGFIVGLASWVFYGTKTYTTGISVPETISSLAVIPWILHSAVKLYSEPQ
ncbi:MAG: DUF998 domain-containing protein [Candidatus Bathyarchaeota archaeon]|nr:MAG: DUF998 domain-containing protein [Candidatus Bathyarchaeota archaeon]